MQSASMHGAVADEVNRRLTAATQDLENKYASGGASAETSVDGPSGQAYKEKYMKEQQMKKQMQKNRDTSSSGPSSKGLADLDDEEGDDEDNELRKLREQRLEQIKKAELQRLENIGKGHGQYREITQDEFLAEVTSSKRVVCQFYHKDFARCEIMNHHIQKIAPRHIECKFIKINAEKAPFFVDKLKIRTIPSLICFLDGVAVDKIVGFEGLSDGLPEGKEDEWPTIRLSNALASKSMIDRSKIVDEDEENRVKQLQYEAMRKNAYMTMCVDDDDLFDD